MKSVTHSKAITHVQMSVRPWRNGWLELEILTGWMRWWSSLSTTVESVRILGGMIVVTFSPSSISEESLKLLGVSPRSVSGYRHESGSLLSVFSKNDPLRGTSSSKSVIHSYASLDDTVVEASQTLRALRHECRRMTGGYE